MSTSLHAEPKSLRLSTRMASFPSLPPQGGTDNLLVVPGAVHIPCGRPRTSSAHSCLLRGYDEVVSIHVLLRRFAEESLLSDVGEVSVASSRDVDQDGFAPAKLRWPAR